MKRFFVLATLASLILTACDSEDPFKVTPTQIGPLTQQTQVNELKTLFAQDSVVNNNSSADAIDPSAKIIAIYEKNGDQLLSLKPKSDDSQTIETIQIFDERYTTQEGINLNSTFKDIQDAYTISKIETLLSSVIIFVNDINAYFTIDKKELPSELQFDPSARIEAAQIPDGAQIKYFMIGW